MSDRFTAQLPDGSRGRTAWFLWMAAGLLFGRAVLQLTVVLIGALELVQSLAPPTGQVGQAILSALAVGVVAAILVVCARFASRRMLMPPEVWYTVMVAPVLGGLLALPAATDGDLGFLSLFALALTAILLAWGWVQWRGTKDEATSANDPSTSV